MALINDIIQYKSQPINGSSPFPTPMEDEAVSLDLELEALAVANSPGCVLKVSPSSGIFVALQLQIFVHSGISVLAAWCRKSCVRVHYYQAAPSLGSFPGLRWPY